MEKIVDIVGMMRPLTKLARQIVSTSQIPTQVRNAFRIAQEERPGAVHLELPEDIAAEVRTLTTLEVNAAGLAVSASSGESFGKFSGI